MRGKRLGEFLVLDVRRGKIVQRIARVRILSQRGVEQRRCVGGMAVPGSDYAGVHERDLTVLRRIGEHRRVDRRHRRAVARRRVHGRNVVYRVSEKEIVVRDSDVILPWLDRLACSRLLGRSSRCLGLVRSGRRYLVHGLGAHVGVGRVSSGGSQRLLPVIVGGSPVLPVVRDRAKDRIRVRCATIEQQRPLGESLGGIELIGVESIDSRVERIQPRLLLTPLRDQSCAFRGRLFDDRERRIRGHEQIDRAGWVRGEAKRAPRNDCGSIRLHQEEHVRLATQIVARGRIVGAVIDETQHILQVLRRISLVRGRECARHRELGFGDIAPGIGGRIAGGHGVLRHKRRGDECAKRQSGRNPVHKSLHQGSP